MGFFLGYLDRLSLLWEVQQHALCGVWTERIEPVTVPRLDISCLSLRPSQHLLKGKGGAVDPGFSSVKYSSD